MPAPQPSIIEGDEERTEREEGAPEPAARPIRMRLTGAVPPEMWNRLGTKLIPKLKQGANLRGWKLLDSYIERWAGTSEECCRLLRENSESVTKCYRLKLAADKGPEHERFGHI